MSQQIAMPNQLTPADVTTIKTAIAGINAVVSPINVALTDTQDKGLINVGSNRSAQIAAIEVGLMQAFPVTIPTSFTLAQFLALDQEQIDSNTLAGLFTTLAKEFEMHGKIVGNNRMLMAIEVMDNARLLAKTNTGISAAVKLITTEYLTPGPKSGMTTYSIAPAVILQLTGLKKGKKIINNGTTILTFLAKNASAADTLTINPGDSKDAPLGWVNVTVTNLSTTNAGSFQVFLTA